VVSLERVRAPPLIVLRALLHDKGDCSKAGGRVRLTSTAAATSSTTTASTVAGDHRGEHQREPETNQEEGAARSPSRSCSFRYAHFHGLLQANA
jgi:hypothetical protein